MTDLVAFLRARLDEHERGIRQAIATAEWGVGEFDLADVEAKRRILDECAYWRDKVEASANADAIPYPCLPDRWEVVAPVLRFLALPYADHPDYREEWKP